MSFERLVKKPRLAVGDMDDWVRLEALSAISRNPVMDDCLYFQDLIESNDPKEAFLAFKGLSKLFNTPSSIIEIWRELFSETIELLKKRAVSSSGSSQLRIAAIKALAFFSDLSFSEIDSVLKSITSAFSYDSSFLLPEPSLRLLPRESSFDLSEAFGLLLASMPVDEEGAIKILKRELDCQNPDRLIPALLSLQLNPSAEMTDQLLWIARNGEKRVADEAVRALLACGGKKVCLVITSLLKEIRDTDRKAVLLSAAAAADREEIWRVLSAFVRGNDLKLALTALSAVDGFAGADKKEKLALYSEAVRRKEPELIALASLLAFKAGNTKSVKLLRQLLESDSEKHRFEAVKALSGIPAETAVPIILSNFDDETDENIIDQMFLALRKLLPKLKKLEIIESTMLPWLSRKLKSTDAFIRNQVAVLGGCLGPFAEDILITALSKETHPYVIASLLSALGRCGCNKLLLFTEFHDHKDARIRANTITALLNCGNEAASYFYEALNDSSPRIRAAAAYNLFMIGQLKSVGVLNSMLQIPEPLSVLSACYAFSRIFKIVLPSLEADNPLILSVGRLALNLQRGKQIGPGLLNSPDALDLFYEMSSAGGDRKKILWMLEEKHKRRPSSLVITRVLASVYILSGNETKALPLMEICVRENPTDLADLLDAYRVVLKLGDLNRANDYGDKTKKLYKMLLDGCIELCRGIRGTGAALMLQRLNFLTEPSMNLYNAMIQLKVAEDDPDTVMYLMTELILARPFNINLINKLAAMMPDKYTDMKQALIAYSNSIAI